MIQTAKNSTSVANQIAALLNAHNQLNSRYSGKDILASEDSYYPLVIRGVVAASVGIHKLNYLLSEIRHLVVAPQARNLGFGKEMVKLAMKQAKTPLLCATIREENSASMKVFLSLGFRRISKINFQNHSIFFLMRER